MAEIVSLYIDTSSFDEIFAKLGPKGAATISARALRAAGNILAAAQRDHAPELDEDIPGSDSLKAGAVKDDIQVRLDIDGVKDYAKVRVGPGPATRYVVRWLEEGHEMVSHHGGNKKKGELIGKTGFVEPYHGEGFIVPAFNAAAEDAIEKAADIIADGINGELGEGTIYASDIAGGMGMETLESPPPPGRDEPRESRQRRSKGERNLRAKQDKLWQKYVDADRDTRGDWADWQNRSGLFR